MAKIGLVSCVSQKSPFPAPASELYLSPLFQKASTFAKTQCDRWYILSAKYGLVDPAETVTPYNETLNAKSERDRREWSGRVWDQLRQRVAAGDEVMILAGTAYRKYLLPLLESHGCLVQVPMLGLGIGEQLSWLTKRLGSRAQHVDRLYELLRMLEAGVGGKRTLGACSGKMDWPERGLYLFFEPGELRPDGAEMRVVRVGTHAVSAGSKSTLWGRLRQHRGGSDGGGNHRGSIFRLHVGMALGRRDPRLHIPTWGQGQNCSAVVKHAEEHVEQAVSAHIGKMSLLWLDVGDTPTPASDRAYLERNLIGLLTGAEKPSDGWLGRFSAQPRIVESGLWNLDHIGFDYDPEFLDVLDQYVSVTIGRCAVPALPLAPAGWHAKNCKC